MASSAFVGPRTSNRVSRVRRASVKVGLCASALSLAVVLTPGLAGVAAVKAAIPPPHAANPAPADTLIADCFRQARDAAQSTLDWQHRVSSLLAIGRAQLVSGDAAGARTTALDALRQIPADAGNPEDVGSNIGNTDGIPLKGILAEAIELLAQSGDPAGALRAADRLHDGEDRAETLLTIADVCVARRDLAGAKNALNEALKSALPLHDDSDRGETLSRIAFSWQRIDPQRMPPSLIADTSDALHGAEKAWDWGRAPVKYVNRRWNPVGNLSLTSRLFQSYVRIDRLDEAARSERAFQDHGFTHVSGESPDETNAFFFGDGLADVHANSSLHTPDLVPIPFNRRLRPVGYANLLAASRETDSWMLAAAVTQVAERPFSSLSDPERKLVQQVRSDLVGHAAKSADGIDRAFLLCAAARLDLLIGDREDARGLIGQAANLYDASASETSFAVRQMGRKSFPQSDADRDKDIHGVLLLRLSDALCALGDFSGAARLVDEKGGSFRCVVLQKIAYHAADARSARRALTIAAEIEASYGTIMANQTLNGITNRLIRQRDWDDAHQAALSIKDPSARVHALVNLIDGYYGRESAY